MPEINTQATFGGMVLATKTSRRMWLVDYTPLSPSPFVDL